MEQEVTLQELVARMNDQEGKFIIHVYFGEEDEANAKEESI